MQPDSADAARIWDMHRFAMQTVQFITDVSLEEFQADQGLRLAVERTVQIVGEAARRVSPSFRAAHPEIAWRQIVGLRNVLVHEYGKVRVELVWDVATVHMPELLTQLERLLPPPHDPS